MYLLKELIDVTGYPVRPVLKTLLSDKTTKQNIVFATDSYSSYGDRYMPDSHIEMNLLLGMNSCLIQPRVLKNKQEQSNRTKEKAEVMTPAWVVNNMNNHCDEDWFGYPDVFNVEDGEGWKTNKNRIKFPKDKDWMQYVDITRLEITCGEAPYLVSRYDTTTGEIISVKDRIGALDRKLRVIGENTDTKEEWLKWVIRAYESTYGYEYQGDNLLIGRINLLITFVDYMQDKFDEVPTDAELRKIANIIAWNLWQMDGLTGCVPYATHEVTVNKQLSIFDIINEGENISKKEQAPLPAKIYDWRGNESIEFNKLKEQK